MARMRYVKPEFWTDSTLVRCSRDARLLYIGTWNFAMCEEGHLEDDPLRLKLQIFPLDDVDVAALLTELIDKGRIIREAYGDDTYLRIPHLRDHQKTDARWTPRCPACKAASPSDVAPASTNPAETLPNSAELATGGDRRGGEGIGEESAPSAPAADDTTATRRKPERPLPQAWKPNAKHYEFALERGVDVRAEAESFRNHADTHDRRARDWDAAFRTWLSKARPTTRQAGPTTSPWDRPSITDRRMAGEL